MEVKLCYRLLVLVSTTFWLIYLTTIVTWPSTLGRYLTLKRKNEAAAKVQAWWRMATAVKDFQTTRAAVIRMQAIIRGHQTRARLKREVAAVLTVQKAFKRCYFTEKILWK
jgi:hypothetical protein